MMKPEKKYSVYWSCGLGHHHETEHAAQQCLDRQESKRRTARKDKITKTRNIDITRRWINGETEKTIAKDVGIAKSRIKRITIRVFTEAERIFKNWELPYDEFTLKHVDAVARHWGVE